MQAASGAAHAADAAGSPSASSQPSELNTAAQGHGLEVHRDKLTIQYKGDGRHNSDVGSIQANRPVPLRSLIYYFELTVLEKGEGGRVGIGFTPANFKLTKQPGWEPGSYGYHGDDGKKFGGNGKGEDYGPRYTKGDTVGAAYCLATQEIFFTKNGVKLRTAFRRVWGELFPTVGLHSKGEVVCVNFGHQPFKYDIEALVLEERAARATAIEGVPLSTQLVHGVVRQYLLHYAYHDTLAAFDADMGAECDDPCSMSVDAADDPACEPGAADGSHGAQTPASNGGSAAAADDALKLRQHVRRAIMRGDVHAAIDCIRGTYPEILDSAAPGYEVVRFHLATQQYIELISAGSVGEAIAFAQRTLAPMRHRLAVAAAATASAGMSDAPAAASTPAAPPLDGTSPSEAELCNVVALVAYEKPAESPLAWLLGPAQRERVADAANAAVLAAARGQPPQSVCVSGLERLLAQLASVRATQRENNHNQGEGFDLRQHLLPPVSSISSARQQQQQQPMQH